MNDATVSTATFVVIVTETVQASNSNGMTAQGGASTAVGSAAVGIRLGLLARFML
jgi:hypothetical protein